MKVVVSEPIHASALATLSKVAEVELCADPQNIDLSTADALIVRAARVTRQMLANAPRLKVIGKHGVGVNAIDVACARERGIAVVYTPDANSNAVAELAFAHMLAAARKLKSNDRLLMQGAARIAPPHLGGLELTGKTMGLVGYGHIGSRVAHIAQHGFGMHVIVYDPYLAENVLKEAGLERAESVQALLAHADCINVSVPLTESTKGLIGKAELLACKPTAILVNTSRGGVVDEQALYDALVEQRLFAAASDVFVQEPPQKDCPLLALDNFLGSLHVGASTEEALQRVGQDVVADVLAVLAGQEPKHPYTGPAPYFA